MLGNICWVSRIVSVQLSGLVRAAVFDLMGPCGKKLKHNHENWESRSVVSHAWFCRTLFYWWEIQAERDCGEWKGGVLIGATETEQ